MEGTGKQRRPSAAAVTAVVAARTTSTATMLQPSLTSGRCSWKQSIATVGTGRAASLADGLGTETRLPVGVRVQSATVDLHAQEFLEPHVAEPHVWPEVID
jgi:hypothetical protein